MTKHTVWLATVGAIFVIGFYSAPAVRPLHGTDAAIVQIDPKLRSERNAERSPTQDAAAGYESNCKGGL